PFCRIALRVKAPLEGLLARSISRHRHRQHVFLRIAVACSPRPTPPRQHLETRPSAPPAQSNCVRSRACLRMLFASRARLSRSGVVVPGIGNDSSRLRPRGKTLPPLRRADPANCSGRPVNLLLQALSEVGVYRKYEPIT